MSKRGTDRRRVAAAVGLTVGVALAGVTVAVVVVVIVSGTATEFALSDGFFWASAVAAVFVQLLVGTLAGRLAAPRLRRAGVTEGLPRYALAAAGPATVSLLASLHPVEGIPPVPGVLLPVVAAAGGAAMGVRWAAGRRYRSGAAVRY
ncbi:hypothetical protein [Actinomadura sp. HBU206391]|uniref:hypothetical protein n=1 Tax=Actinomadura sp. HBU206391 TaxID=2731692 RepID=UPI001650D467|nr:hypothetical protein [Actinomadura sp. HBU206391]MBC6457758.1 hypothetical protein [Actinomadura sp. HBU206391]